MVVDGGEFLQTLHPPEAEHGPFPSSKWLVRILTPIVQPTAGFLASGRSDLPQCSAVGPKLVGHENICRTMFLDGFIEKFQRSFLVPRLRHEAFQHLAFMVDGPPQVMPLAIDLECAPRAGQLELKILTGSWF